ncbi:hypothetical protein EMCRGX_G003498 [Ephydatia muelleri]
MIVRATEKDAAKALFGELGIKIVSGHRFLGGFVGEKDEVHDFVLEKVTTWTSGVNKLAEAAEFYPQAAFAALSKTTGKTAAFDISVTSPLNTLTLLEAGVSASSAAQATETRKHMANDAKCNELGWLCVPLVAETYGAWGKEAMEAFSQLDSQLATHTCRLKSAVTFELYSRLKLHLVRANATAILTRCIQS